MNFKQRQQKLIKARQAVRLNLELPDGLPISGLANEIKELIQHNQVIIIAGETGSGKTTQLPKLCLALGLGIQGIVGHTQPRRIAAKSVATRIAEEIGTELGAAVGFKVRFTDKVAANTRLKLMTDGILLQELKTDYLLRQYDALIIDEAHERSLNIDFILGYVTKILPSRPDLKVIITSATLEVEKFAKHFNNAPVLTIPGNTYPVTVEYLPEGSFQAEDSIGEQSKATNYSRSLTKLNNLFNEQILFFINKALAAPGDILVFLSGEREIREVADFLLKQPFKHVEILTLFGRMDLSKQAAIFQQTGSMVRIILATNVAETSITVPNIKYVIDSGQARVSRYNYRSKIQRLLVEPISQASAKQRKGRCGRVSAGVCYRMYTEADLLSRDDYTTPEILRTNLAAVILQMQALKLGDIEQFAFIDSPDSRYIKDGVRLLKQLGALDSKGCINQTGRMLAKLPLDVRLAKVLLMANHYRSLSECLIIVSFLAGNSPKENPIDAREKARSVQQKFSDKNSDFISILKIWAFYQANKQQLSKAALRSLCKANFLSYKRMLEWEDLYQQLKQICLELNFSLNQQEGSYGAVHKAMLAGFLDHIGCLQDNKEYLGARGNKFLLHPSSFLAKKPPKWSVCFEIVLTSKVYARENALIEPEWIIELAPHLVNKTYFEPYYSSKFGCVMAKQNTSLYGILLEAGKRVRFETINPNLAREVFIQQALVEDNLTKEYPFLQHNRQLLAELDKVEDKLRDRSIIIEDSLIFEFYSTKLGQEVLSQATLEEWLQDNEKLLYLEKDFLINSPAKLDKAKLYPDRVKVKGLDLALTYKFEPGSEDDGVTYHIPVLLLNQLTTDDFAWLVPGFIEEKVVALLRSLPKQKRLSVSPALQFAQAFLSAQQFHTADLLDSLVAWGAHIGVKLFSSEFNLSNLAKHLLANFQVVDNKKNLLYKGRDLAEYCNKDKRKHFVHAANQETEFTQEGLTEWSFADIPIEFKLTRAAAGGKVYPALVDRQDSVAIQCFATAQEAVVNHVNGLTRLYTFYLGKELKYITKELKLLKKVMEAKRYEEVLAKVLFNIVQQLYVTEATRETGSSLTKLVRGKEEFLAKLSAKQHELMKFANQYIKSLEQVFTFCNKLQQRLMKVALVAQGSESIQDIEQQFNMLQQDILTADLRNLQRISVYLLALQKRLDKLPNPKDKILSFELLQLTKLYTELDLAKLSPEQRRLATEYRWALEEYRISLFAQPLKTLYPISQKRLLALYKKIQ